MAACVYSPIGPAANGLGDPSPLIPELVILRRRMVRDLERFLRIQLSLPGTLMLRWPWARKATTKMSGSVGVGVDSE